MLLCDLTSTYISRALWAVAMLLLYITAGMRLKGLSVRPRGTTFTSIVVLLHGMSIQVMIEL